MRLREHAFFSKPKLWAVCGCVALTWLCQSHSSNVCDFIYRPSSVFTVPDPAAGTSVFGFWGVKRKRSVLDHRVFDGAVCWSGARGAPGRTHLIISSLLSLSLPGEAFSAQYQSLKEENEALSQIQKECTAKRFVGPVISTGSICSSTQRRGADGSGGCDRVQRAPPPPSEPVPQLLVFSSPPRLCGELMPVPRSRPWKHLR